MVCQVCGKAVEGTFCSKCGAQVQAAAAMYAPPHMMYVPRVQQHVQTLGIMWCVYGAYRAVAGIFAALFLLGMSQPGFWGGFGGWASWGGHGGMPFFINSPFFAGIGTFVAVISLIFAAASFLVGFSLMNRKPWGRTLAIVIAILQLIKIPFGTALGIYTLWVLAPEASGAEYDAIAER